MARQVYDDLVARPDSTAPGWRRVAALVLALLVLGGGLALAAALVWVSVHARGPEWVPLALAWLVVIVLRPRRRRLPDAVLQLDRAECAGIHRLVAEAADAAGVRPPAIVGVDLDLNASVWPVGWRRRPALVLGLPLFSLGSWQLRLGILAHELGHLRGRDTLAGRVVAGASELLGGVRYLTSPSRERYVTGASEGNWGRPIVAAQANVARRVADLLLIVVASPAIAAQWLLTWLMRPVWLRQEYLADRRAARWVGTDAMAAALAWNLPGVEAATAAAARRGEEPYAALLARPDPGPAQVAARAAEQRIEVDPWASHPPDQYRIRLLLAAEVPGRVEPAVLSASSDAEAELVNLRRRTVKDFSELLRFGPAR